GPKSYAVAEIGCGTTTTTPDRSSINGIAVLKRNAPLGATTRCTGGANTPERGVKKFHRPTGGRPISIGDVSHEYGASRTSKSSRQRRTIAHSLPVGTMFL